MKVVLRTKHKLSPLLSTSEHPLKLISLMFLVLVLGACGTTAEIDPKQSEAKPGDEITLADLHFDNGAQAIFSYNEEEQSYTLSQSGDVGQSKPFAMAESASMLELFLEMTPDNVAIPELLLAEPALSGHTMPNVSKRLTSIEKVSVDLVATDVSLETLGASCNDYFITGSHYRNLPRPDLEDATFYSSNFGGKYRYVDSYLINCTPSGYLSSRWARHRIYYKNAWGNYKKHLEQKIGPWRWDIVRKGSIKRYRKVVYDENFPFSCHACQYGREGKFLN